jgi:tRNA pseudouridine32 synthase/23S rRNA pseudouridine746 synthase
MAASSTNSNLKIEPSRSAEYVRPPVLNGLAAATLQLPPGSWETVFECLCAHFDRVPEDQWRSRFDRGLVLDQKGSPLSIATLYRSGARVHYYREVIDETPIPFVEQILYVDEHLIVVDKPHFLPVAPVGAYVHQTLLSRLRRRFGNFDLVPLHRIDRGTAGLVMFSANPAKRDAYQALFREQRIKKRYEAIAPALPSLTLPLTRRTRIVRGEPFVRSREVSGEPNTATRIEAARSVGPYWQYTLYPTTGKKHQLRVHLAALGAPILNDDFYPDMIERAADDFTRPLQLVARGLEFTDPLSGMQRSFESGLPLRSCD